MLRAIPKDDVARIQSAQVIVSLSNAMKELVENAIDASSTKITIRFTNHGLDTLEVIDNGAGINEHDFETLAAKSATSKLSQFQDLDKLLTLGFRGEALSSLCDLSDLSVVTCTKATYPLGFSLAYEHDGLLKSKTTVSAAIGTTVRVNNLFYTLPVRRKGFEKNAKKDFLNATKLLQAYAAVHPEVRMEATNLTGKTRIHVLGKNGTTGSNDLRQNLGDVRTFITLDLGRGLTVSFALQNTHGRKDEVTELILDGYLSDVQKQYGGQPDRQLSYINARPCHLPQVFRCINEVYSTLGSNKKPFVFLNLSLPEDCYDVNVTPDKQTIFMHDEQMILQHLREAITNLFSDGDRLIPVTAQKPQSMNRDEILTELGAKFSLDGTRVPAIVSPAESVEEDSEIESLSGDYMEQSGSESDDNMLGHQAVTLKRLSGPQVQGTKRNRGKSPQDFSRVTKRRTKTLVVESSSASRRPLLRNKPGKPSHPQEALLNLRETGVLPGASASAVSLDDAGIELEFGNRKDIISKPFKDDQAVFDASKTPEASPEALIPPDAGDVPEYSASPVKPLQRFVHRLNNLDHSNSGNYVHNLIKTMNFSASLVPQASVLRADHEVVEDATDLLHAGIDEDAQIAEQTLSLNVSKSDFFGMTVVGQFNLGFILVLRQNEIFIIDQHASDEKSNYERLLRETIIDSQHMAQPKEIELSSIEKLSIGEHLETLKRNGFDIVVQENKVGDTRYFLTALPVSRNIAFDTSDLLEILSLLVEGSPPDSVRCTKAKRMFASRACRSSIMIGTALTKERMQAIVWHLGEMDAPWNCPHGRPTMRHLASLQAMPKWLLDDSY